MHHYNVIAFVFLIFIYLIRRLIRIREGKLGKKAERKFKERSQSPPAASANRGFRSRSPGTRVHCFGKKRNAKCKWSFKHRKTQKKIPGPGIPIMTVQIVAKQGGSG